MRAVRENAGRPNARVCNMRVQAPFGFVTGCHAHDKFMVQATLASMRHFCPDIPICLVVDGSFDVSDLKGECALIVLRVSELPSNKMGSLMNGNARAKHAVMWEGPFEYYVWLDSDAIIWGTSLRRSHRSIFNFLERDFHSGRCDRNPTVAAAFLF